jgi:hypothetical protein
MYIIGVDHALQHDGPAPCAGPTAERLVALREDFVGYLRDAALAVSPDCIAKEFNQNALHNSHALFSVAQKVSSEVGACHLFCEPTVQERRALGLREGGRQGDYERRERYWLDKLISQKAANVIFICGADHVASFGALLQKNGFSVQVLTSYYAEEDFR